MAAGFTTESKREESERERERERTIQQVGNHSVLYLISDMTLSPLLHHIH